MKNLFILLIISFLQIFAFAQDTISQDLIYLKDGSTLRGEITEQNPDESVKIRIAGGTITEIKMSAVKRIKSDEGKYIFNEDGSNFKQKGFYNGFNVQAMIGQSSGNDNSENLVLGLGVQYSLGYQINKYAAVGGGVGMQLYDKVFADAFVQMRGFLPMGKVSPTIAMDAGYGVPVVLSSLDTNNQSNGGWSLRPSIGLRIATRNRADILLDAGYQLQHFENKTNWGWGSETAYNVWYRRLSFRIGWVF